MKFFFSCDWGTSSFRIKLIDGENAMVLSSIKTGHGVAAQFARWKESGQLEVERMAFYKSYLFEQLRKIKATFSGSLQNAPVILSGMASSSIGMIELPYKELPFQYNGADLFIHTIPAQEDQSQELIIISGVKSASDVIRGEETMLAGCDITESDADRLFIFPGTHSKHIIVSNGLVKSITTYMTGELFDLLSNKSILSASVKKIDNESTGVNNFFVEGVLEGATSNLMNSIFHVRTNQLFKKATLPENYHYLSGLLIGHELKDILKYRPAGITLVCSEGLKQLYTQALTVLELGDHLDYKDADDALVNGQWQILKQSGHIFYP